MQSHKQNTDYITIEAEPGHNPQMGGVSCKYCSYWKFRGLEVSPSIMGTLTYHPQTDIPSIFYGYDNDHLIFEDNYIYTTEDISDWDILDWSNKTWHGINMGARSSYFIFRDNTIKNIAQAVKSTGHHSAFVNNVVDGYASDGIASLESNSYVHNNTIINTYADIYWSGHFHTDAIQTSGYYNLTNITITDNYINALPDPNREGTGAGGSQGLFGGGLYDSVIANNIVMCSNIVHGISYSHQNQWNLVIVNNTVITPYGLMGDNNPDIRLTGPLYDILVKNNIAHGLPWHDPSRNLIVEENANSLELDPMEMFVDYVNSDMRPNPTGPLCDGSINGKPGVAVGALPCQ
jgi:hypothetical protein